MGSFIDSYTNLLNLFPELIGISDILQGVVTVVKQLAVATLKGLDGLQCMRPGGEYLSQLNEGPRGQTAYFALASDFEPKNPGLGTFKDFLMDNIFKQAENDLVVPTAGVYEKNGSEYFPIADRLILDPDKGVAHGGLHFGDLSDLNRASSFLKMPWQGRHQTPRICLGARTNSDYACMP